MIQCFVSLDDKIPLVYNLVRKNIHRFPDLRLFLITPSQWLRVYKGNINSQVELLELAFIRGLRPDRGQILNFFAKLEVLVNELIQAKFLGLLSEKAYEFDDLLQKINFNSKAELLTKWHVIDGNLQNNIKEVQGLRNQLAHRWSEHDVLYKKDTNGKPLTITQNINEFKKDAEEVWIRLINIYAQEENKNIGTLMSKFDDPNTIRAWEEVAKERKSYEDE
jgi:hypothetical protein